MAVGELPRTITPPLLLLMILLLLQLLSQQRQLIYEGLHIT